MSKNISGIVNWLKGWFYDKSEVDNEDIEFIVGTHGTTATATWTGESSKITSLKAGTKIYFKLTSKGASNVTLNLKLATGSWTGAKNVYYNNTTRLSTQYGQNAIIALVYDGSNWRVVLPYTNSTYSLNSLKDANSANYTNLGLSTASLSQIQINDAINTIMGNKVNTTNLATVATSGSYNDLSDRPSIQAWTVLYNGTSGTIKTNGELVSLKFISGSKAISNSSWTEMAKLSNINISSDYFPKTNLYGLDNNAIEMRLTTDGILQAVRRSGSVTAAVTFHAVYLII